MNWITDLLRSHPEFAIYLTIALGFLIAKIRIKGFSLGIVSSVLLVGVIIGQLHIPIGNTLKPVAFLMFHLHARGFEVVAYDTLGGLVCVCRIRQGLGVLRFQAFALVDVENIVVAKQGDFPLFACFFVLLLYPFPEDNHLRLGSLADISTCLLNLFEGGVFAGTTQKHLVQEGVRFARGVGNTRARGDPRLLPRDDAVFHFGNDAGSDFAVNIHCFCSFACGEQSNVVEWICSPDF